MRAKQMTLMGCVLGCVLMTGCDETKRALGYERKSPDAFKSYTRQPLYMPPNYALRPPKPGAERPQEKKPSEAAKNALFGEEKDNLSSSPHSDAEKDLLSNVGPREKDIRDIVDKEADQEKPAETSLRNVLGLSKKKESQGDIIDPIAESERLKKKMPGKTTS